MDEYDGLLYGQRVHAHGLLLDGRREGLWIGLYESGDTAYVDRYANGVLDGSSELFYPNGQRSWIRFYVNDIPRGLTMSWYENGQIKYRAYFDEVKNDYFHGYYESYWENGEPETIGTYYRGYQAGEWLFFDSTGVLVKKIIYPDSNVVLGRVRSIDDFVNDTIYYRR